MSLLLYNKKKLNMLSLILLFINSVYATDCGILLPIHSSDCPPNTFSPSNPFFLPNCNKVEIGELCEGDGECGTNHFLNNCPCGIFRCDVYRKTDSFSPTTSPTHLISYVPSNIPSNMPSNIPSDIPSNMPSNMPSNIPSDIPSNIPSDIPSNIPTHLPSNMPSHLPSNMPTHLPTHLPSDLPSNMPSDLPSNMPTDMPSNGPSTDPCQKYDNSLLCRVDTNYSECSTPLIKALCPYLCAGCVSLSPSTFIKKDGSASQEQTDNKKSVGIITGCSALVVVLIVVFIFLRKKNENLYEQPKMISTIDTNSNKCIQNEIYVPTEYISPKQIHYDLGNNAEPTYDLGDNTEPTYDLGDDDGYLQTGLYEEFRDLTENDF